jgi:hypothetical protein
MRSTIALAISLTLASCVAPRPRPVIVTGAGPPPHVVEVAPGLYCEHGYLLRQGRCVSFLDIATGPVVEMPSAGEGAPTTCPNDGCGFSYVAPTDWGLSVPTYDYGWPYGYGWPYLGYGWPYGYGYSWYGSGVRFPSHRFRHPPPGGFHHPTPHHGRRPGGGRSHGSAHPHGGSGGGRR